YVIDPETLRAEQLAHGDRLTGAIERDYITSILEGGEHDIWIGTENAGVMHLPADWRGFTTFIPPEDEAEVEVVTTVLADGDQIWIGGEHGLRRLMPGESDLRRRWPEVAPGPINTERRGLAVTRDHLWVLQDRGLIRRNRADGSEPRLIELQTGAFEYVVPRFVHPASDQTVWLGIDGVSLALVDREGAIVDQWLPDAEPPRQMPALTPKMMRRGPDDRWWLLGGTQVYRQREDGSFEAMLPNRGVSLLSMLIDGEVLWLASDSTLERFRIDAGGLRREARWTDGDGLPAGLIHSVQRHGRDLWLITSNGMARLDLDSGRFRRFSAAEGLLLSEALRGAVDWLNDGRLAVGTTRGLLIVDPDRIGTVESPPPVWLTSMRAGDRQLELVPGGPRRFELGWRENSLRFDFVALSFVHPDSNRFRARLIGWEDDWSETMAERSRYYSNLPHGHYRFEVQAASADGLWNRAGDAVEISIAPPPWQAPPALAGYALLALGVTGLAWRSFRTRGRRREDLRRALEQRQLA
ncbi:MAG: triple tyrosine motif-containing protein, partial [Wenzhouxiangellaceae bacterium]